MEYMTVVQSNQDPNFQQDSSVSQNWSSSKGKAFPVSQEVKLKLGRQKFRSGKQHAVCHMDARTHTQCTQIQAHLMIKKSIEKCFHWRRDAETLTHSLLFEKPGRESQSGLILAVSI